MLYLCVSSLRVATLETGGNTWHFLNNDFFKKKDNRLAMLKQWHIDSTSVSPYSAPASSGQYCA